MREPTGDITVIYRFVGKPTVLTRPWKLRLVLEATPTKPLPAGWRTWRDAAPFAGPSADYRRWRSDVKLWIAYPWPHKAAHRHFAFPVVKDPNWFRDHVKNLHAGGPGMWRDNKTLPKKGTPGLKSKRLGNRVLPYSMFAFMAPGMPECDFYWREWYNPLGFSSLGQGLYKYAAVRPVPSYIDFMVWKHRELIREYGHDGLYVDFAGLCQPVLDVKHGLGYERVGVQRPAEFPIVANREIWKRMYTMLRKEKPESLIVGHTSENSCAPLLSFLDVWEPGEGNWFGQLRDNYWTCCRWMNCERSSGRSISAASRGGCRHGRGQRFSRTRTWRFAARTAVSERSVSRRPITCSALDCFWTSSSGRSPEPITEQSGRCTRFRTSSAWPT